MNARERCFRTCLQHGRRWEMGEERSVDSYDEDGLPVVSPHFRLIEAGDPTPANDVFTPAEQSARQFAELRGDRTYGIRKALEALDPENNADWTIKGDPSLQRVYAIAGFDVQRGDIREAWPEFDRNLAKQNRQR